MDRIAECQRFEESGELDIHMPGINGLETASLLRREVPKAKIIVMSQDDVIQWLPIVIQAGGDDCMDKSRIRDLLARIKDFESASEVH